MKRFTQRVGSLLLCCLLMLSVAGSLLVIADKAEAQSGPSAEWIDRTHIMVHERVGAFTRDRIYTDSNLDDRYNFKDLNQGGECQSELWVDGPDSTSGDLIVIVTDSGDGNCQLRWSGGGGRNPGDVVLCEGAEGRYLWDRDGYTNPAGGADTCDRNINAGRISISSADAGAVNFRFVDDNTIERVDGQWTFIRDGSSNTFLLDEEGACRDSVILDGGTRTVNGQTVRTGIHRERSADTGGRCLVDERRDALVTEQENPNPGEGGDDDNGEEAPPSCESEGGSLSWIICPVLFLGDAVLRKLDQAVISLLSIPSDYYNNPDLERAWSRLRDLAYLILVPIMLVMVIGTALGFDFVSAYTVKRALPRLVIAAIFIALSFEITKFLVVLTNDVGRGIGGFIIGAFAGSEEINIASLFTPGARDSTVALPLFVLAGAGAAVIGGLGVILSFIFVAIIGLAMGFFLLSFRQMLVIALMILAPLAILAWIFPGNDKLWKLWWGTFSKLLLLFPLIMLLISVGKVFALLIQSTDSSIVSTLMKLVAYVGPYFLIPATFKFAGGVFATISGMANDRSKGVFDRQRKFRQEKMAKNRELAGRNARWNPNSFLGKKFNSGAGWVADPYSNARIAAGTRGGESIMNRVNQAKNEHTGKLAQRMGSAGFNDKALQGLSVGAVMRNENGEAVDEHGQVVTDETQAARVRYDGSGKSMDQVIANMERSDNEAERAGAQQLRDNGGFLRDIYDDEEVGRASVQGAAGLALASQGFATAENIAQISNELDGPDSRHRGMGAMFKTQAELLNHKAGGLTKPGYSLVVGADGQWEAAAGLGPNHGANIERAQSISVSDLAGAKGQAIGALSDTYRHILTAPVDTEYTRMDGTPGTITQDMKNGVLHTLTMASQSYNNPDVAARTTAILRDSLPPAQFEAIQQRGRGRGRDDAEHERLYRDDDNVSDGGIILPH